MFDTTQITNIGGFFKVNCGVMDGDLKKYSKHYD